MKTEPFAPPDNAARSDPVRELRSLAERLIENAGQQIERHEHQRAPEWLERDLASCEAFIRETSAVAGLGLDYEGGRELADARRDRRDLLRARAEALRPHRNAAELLRVIRARLGASLRKCRSKDPRDLKALLAVIDDLGLRLSEAEAETLKEARTHIRGLLAEQADENRRNARTSRGAIPAGHASDRSSHLAAGGAPGPERGASSPGAGAIARGPSFATDPPAELLARYLSPPAALEFEPAEQGMLERLSAHRYDDPEDCGLNRAAMRLSLLGGFEVLLCLPLLRGVEQHPFQINTARQVMRNMRGRALLCDEVGLGKTIEAGLVLKEYALRGLARRVLILTPPSLVSQWRDEMRDKFGIEFLTLDDAGFHRHGDDAWERCERVIASLHTAKSARNREAVQRVAYDLIIVDEAHHLRNRGSVSWKFANQLKSKYLLLLTATPAQNDLDELFSLITLLSPGQLKSPADFRREFVERDDPRRPRNRTKLHELLMDVMVRNSRSQVSINLPPREATTLQVALSPAERSLYEEVTLLVRSSFAHAGDGQARRMALRTLQAEAGSSAQAVRSTLETMRDRPGAVQPELLEAALALAARVETSGKAVALVDLLRSRVSASEKVLIFTQYLETQAFVLRVLEQAGVAAARFNGTLSAAEKDAEVAAFAGDRRVLVSTDVGSEGRNLQFCHTIVNYDLPWNPMRIEQRVGRVHRIGQTEPVRIWNLAAPDTLEGHILEVLDSKINMFELVVGEIGEILGNLEEEREFEDIVLDLWAGADSDPAAAAGLAALGERLAGARQRYVESKAYDEALFGQDFVAPE